MPPGRYTPAYVDPKKKAAADPYAEPATYQTDASTGGGTYAQDPYSAPPQAAAPLVPAGTPPPPTQTIDYPTAGPRGNTALPYDYGQQVVPGAVTPPPSGGVDTQVPNPTDKITRRIGQIRSWWDGPTTAAEMGEPPPPTPRLHTNLWGAVAGTGRFLHNYLGRPGQLANDLLIPYLNDDTMANEYGTYPQSPEDVQQGVRPQYSAFRDSQERLGPTLGTLNALGRSAWFDKSSATLSPAAYAALDRTDAYMGIDQDYLTRMRRMPEYLQPILPLIAQAAHAITKAPGPTWMEGQKPSNPNPGPGLPREQTLEPGVYYDDPYIPGPDKKPKRRTF
jgi:hypothetical protein